MTIVNCKDCHNENCRECGNYMRSTCWAFKEAPKLTTNYDRIGLRLQNFVPEKVPKMPENTGS